MGIKIKSKAISIYDKENEVNLDILKGSDWIPTSEELDNIASSAAEKLTDKIDNLVVTSNNLTNVLKNGGTLDLKYNSIELPEDQKGDSFYMINYYYDGISPNKNVVIKNGKITSSGAFIRLYLDNKTITFQNVVFDNIGFVIPNGEYTFENCTFTHCYYNCIKIKGAAVCNCYNTTFIDCSPDKNEFLYQLMLIENDIRGLMYCQISHEASGATLRLKDCTFKNLCGTNVIHSSCTDADDSALRLEVDKCVFQDTWGTAIGLSSTGSNGWIKNCKFERLGSLRCREGWEDKEAYGNLYATSHGYDTGTTDYFGDTVYYCGVGCNAIYNWTRSNNKRSSLIIEGNIIKNVVENGIEGCFESVINNFIENTGYRVSEKIYNPSMNGMYIEAKTVQRNIVINPARGFMGIHIARGSWHVNDDDTPCVVKDNTVIYNLAGVDGYNEAAGITFSPRSTQEYEDTECSTVIENNFVAGFQAKYDFANYSGLRSKCIIRDDGIRINNTKLIDNTGSNRLTGADIDSISARKGLEKNEKFNVWLDNELLNWRTDHCIQKLMQRDNQYYLYLQQDDSLYCAALSTYLNLPNVTGLIRIEADVMSTSGMCGIVAKSETIDNSKPKMDNINTGSYMSDSQYDTLLCGVDGFKSVVTTIPVFGRTRISILNVCTNTNGEDTKDEIRIRNPRFTWIQNESYCETGLYGDEEVEITDFANIENDASLDGSEMIPYLVNKDTSVRIWSTDPSDGNGEYKDFNMDSLGTAVWFLQQYRNYAGGKMTLLNDVIVTKIVYALWAGTLDLCGHTWASDKNYSIFCGYTTSGQSDKTLHIKDSSEAKTGKILATNGNAITVSDYGNISLEDGVTIEASEHGVWDSGDDSSVTIKSCTITSGIDKKGLALNNKTATVTFDAENDGFDISNFQLINGSIILKKNTKLENKRYQAGSDDYTDDYAEYGIITSLKGFSQAFNTNGYHLIGTVSENFLSEDLSAHSDFSSTNVYQNNNAYENLTLNSAYYYAYNNPTLLTKIDILDNVEDYMGLNWYSGNALIDIDWLGHSFTNECQSFGFMPHNISSFIFRDTVGGSVISCTSGRPVQLIGTTNFELYNCKLQGSYYGISVDSSSNFIMNSGEVYCSGTSDTNYAIYNNGTTQILGGTIKSDGSYSIYMGSSSSKLKLTAGDIYGKLYIEGTTEIAPEKGKTIIFNNGCYFKNTPTTTSNISITLNGTETTLDNILNTDGIVVITYKEG